MSPMEGAGLASAVTTGPFDLPVLDHPVFDRRAFDEWVDDVGDDSLVLSIGQLYLELLPVRADALRVGAEHWDQDAVIRLAHGLGSASCMFGLQRLAAASAVLERAPDPGAVHLVLGLMDPAVRALRRRLRELQVTRDG